MNNFEIAGISVAPGELKFGTVPVGQWVFLGFESVGRKEEGGLKAAGPDPYRTLENLFSYYVFSLRTFLPLTDFKLYILSFI